MSDLPRPSQPPTALDQLVGELLGAGAVLSQIISGMIRYEAESGPVPDAAPIPDVAHGLLVRTLSDLRHHYSRRDLKVAARILKEATDCICENIYYVPPHAFDGLSVDDDAAGPPE